MRLIIIGITAFVLSCWWSCDRTETEDIPPPPVGLAAAPTGDGVLLSWKPGSEEPVSEYRIFRATVRLHCVKCCKQQEK